MRYIVLAATALLVAGCALSPQQVEIKPTPETTFRNLGHNQAVKVIAVDARSQKAFGSRGGVYAASATITPANSVQQAIADAVRQGLQGQGFNAYNPDDAATALEVRLEKLAYLPEDGSIVNKVTLKLTLKATATRGDASRTSTYKTSVDHGFVFTPSQAQNRTMLNDILRQGIERLLDDQKMIAFLAGNDHP